MPHLLIAADANWIIDDVRSTLEDRDTSFTICRSGQEVVPAAMAKTPDLAVLDLQIGNMGGMATCMSLRLDESAGRLPHVRVLMLLDRAADIHLARRSGAEGWLLRPFDPLRLRRAALVLLDGDTYREGLPGEPAEAPTEPAEPAEPPPESPEPATADDAEAASAAEAEPGPPRGDEIPTG